MVKGKKLLKRKRKQRRENAISNPFVNNPNLSVDKESDTDLASQVWLNKRKEINQVKINYKNRILMPINESYPDSWSKKGDSYKELREQKKLSQERRKEYISNDLIPFYNKTSLKGRGRVSNEVFDLTELRSKVETVDIAVEKTTLLTEDEDNDNDLTVGSFKGQTIQAKTTDQLFQGLYLQDARKNEIHRIFKADIVRVDSDDTGHYLAMMNELYSGQKAKEYYFGGKKGNIDKSKANRFLAKQIISSLAYQRNKAIKDAIADYFKKVKVKDEFKDQKIKFSPLSFRNSSGQPDQLSASEEQLAIAYRIFMNETFVKVNTSDIDKDIIFEYKGEDLDDDVVPILVFEPKESEVKPLDSDELLQIGVERLKLEPDSIQQLLEGLYNQGWINYPRTDTKKAANEPIYLLRDLDSKYDESGKLISDGFVGTEFERNLLKIIDEANKSVKAGKPFQTKGDWVLKQGNTELRTSGRKLADEFDVYDHKAFDITIEKGISPIVLTNYLVDNQIATPATRTVTLSALKQAGVISLDKNRKYQLDRRGVVFASAYNYFNKNNIQTSIEIKNKLTKMTDIGKMSKLVNKFDVLERKQLAKFIEKEALIFLEMQDDLTELDSF